MKIKMPSLITPLRHNDKTITYSVLKPRCSLVETKVQTEGKQFVRCDSFGHFYSLTEVGNLLLAVGQKQNPARYGGPY